MRRTAAVVTRVRRDLAKREVDPSHTSLALPIIYTRLPLVEKTKAEKPRTLVSLLYAYLYTDPSLLIILTLGNIFFGSSTVRVIFFSSLLTTR